MLKSIILRNFRSHRNSKIKLSKGITGIIGPSLSGKTNFIRGVIWANDNKPSGFKFHSRFDKSKKASVKIRSDRGTVLVTKKPKSHIYKVNGKQFRKFGRQVPDEVKRTLNLNDINFQTQLRGTFLILSPPGQIAKTISEIVNTEQIDNAIRSIRKKNSEINLEKKILSNDIEKLQIRLDALEILDEIKPKIKKLKRVKKQVELQEDKLNRLIVLQRQIKDTQEAVTRQTKTLKVKPLLKKLDGIGYKIEDFQKELKLIKKIEETEENINNLEKEIAKQKNQYIKELKKQKKCPTCFTKINNEQIKTIRKNL